MEPAVECAVLSVCLQTCAAAVSLPAAWAGAPAVEVVMVTAVVVVVAAATAVAAAEVVAVAGAAVECWGCRDQVTWWVPHQASAP